MQQFGNRSEHDVIISWLSQFRLLSVVNFVRQDLVINCKNFSQFRIFTDLYCEKLLSQRNVTISEICKTQDVCISVVIYKSKNKHLDYYLQHRNYKTINSNRLD